MNHHTERIAILGSGNIGLSLAKGLVKSGKYITTQITLTRRNINALTDFKTEGFQVTNDNSEAVKNATILVLAVLPQQLNKLLHEISPYIDKERHLMISVISGVSCQDIRKQLNQEVAVVRAMPNTAIAISASMTCIASDQATAGQIEQVKTIFNTVGITEALEMAAQTAKGAADLLLKLHSHPEQEIDKVTSPKGCTIAGLNEMEHQGFSSALIKGIKTSAEKAGGLYTENQN